MHTNTLQAVSVQSTQHAEELSSIKAELANYKSFTEKVMSLGGIPRPFPMIIPSTNQGFDDVFQQLQQNAPTISADRLDNILSEATVAHSSITDVENRVSAIDQSVENLLTSVNELERYLREWNLLIHGLSDFPVRPTSSDIDGRNRYEFIFIDYVCKKLNELLKGKLYKAVTPQDIERAHILYQGDNNNKPVVIVRFVRRVVRNNVFFSRRALKGTKVSITDHLSKNGKKLLNHAKNAFGPRCTWTSAGKVFARVGDGSSHYIKSDNDINSLLDEFGYIEDPAANSEVTPAAVSEPPSTSTATSPPNTAADARTDKKKKIPPFKGTRPRGTAPNQVAGEKNSQAQRNKSGFGGGVNAGNSNSKFNRSNYRNSNPPRRSYGTAKAKEDLRYNY